MMQGDQYALVIDLTVGGSAPPAEDLEQIEITMPPLRKLWPGDANYSDGKLIIPLKQAETFRLGTQTIVQIRVQYKNGAVVGGPVQRITVGPSLSKVVL